MLMPTQDNLEIESFVVPDILQLRGSLGIWKNLSN